MVGKGLIEYFMKIKILYLVIGIALLAYSLLAMSSLMGSLRAVLMMGSVMQPGSGVVPGRIIAAVFLLFLFLAGAGLVVVSIRGIVKSYNE